MRPTNRWLNWKKAHPIRASLLAICVLNLAWSWSGGWKITFGHHFERGPNIHLRSSGLYSIEGYLILSLRDSFGIYGGRSAKSIRVDSDHSSIGLLRCNTINGILDGTHRFPGIVTHWDVAPRDEWYNRGIAIHWSLLLILFAASPAYTLYRTLSRRRMRDNLCRQCGYDLRASPIYCPECGAPRAATASIQTTQRTLD